MTSTKLAIWLILAFVGHLAEAAPLQGSCMREVIAGDTFIISGSVPKNQMNGDACSRACADLKDPSIDMAAVTQGHVCLCGVDGDNLIAESDATYCEDDLCGDGVSPGCGGSKGRFSVYILSGGKLGEFVPDWVYMEDRSVVLEGVNVGSPTALFRMYRQFGAESPPAQAKDAAGCNNVAGYTSDDALNTCNNPILHGHVGKNLLTSIVTNPDGTQSFATTAIYHRNLEMYPVGVSCPPVAEVNGTSFSCSFAYAGGSLPEFLLQADYNGEALYDIENPIVPKFTHVGTSPTRYVPSGAQVSQNAWFVLRNSRAKEPSVLVDLEVLTKRSQLSYLWGVYDAVCDTGVYNPMNGLCEAEAEAVESANSITSTREETCAADDIFSTFLRGCTAAQCSSTSLTCADQATKSAAFPSGFDKVYGATVAKFSGHASASSATGASLSEHVYIKFAEMDALNTLVIQPGQFLGVASETYMIPTMEGEVGDFDEHGAMYMDVNMMAKATFAELNFVDIEHTCQALSDNYEVKLIYNNSNTASYPFTSDNMTGILECQIAIEGFEVRYDPDVTAQLSEWGDLIYVAVNEDVTVKIITTAGDPIYRSVDYLGNGTDVKSENHTADPREIDETIMYTDEGQYNVHVVAWNLLSDPIYGTEENTKNSTQAIEAEWVVENWQMAASSESWILEDGEFSIAWTVGGNTHLPTNPIMTCHWGDGLRPEPDKAPIVLSDTTTVVQYQYAEQGYYDINCQLENHVSHQNESVEQVLIYNRIVNFQATFTFYDDDQDQSTEDPKNGLGPDGNQIPVDKSVIFLFDYDLGTIEKVKFLNTDTGQIIGAELDVPDKFNARDFKPILDFDLGFHNVSVAAINGLQETEPFPMTFEMVDRVQGLTATQEDAITDDEMPFELTFESFGTSTCVVIDYKDGTVKSYGDETYCSSWKPDVEYVPDTVIESPMTINYAYGDYGIMNVSIEASNYVTLEPAAFNLSATVYGRIIAFEAIPKFPSLSAADGEEPELMDALGPKKNQLPVDRNVTFKFYYEYGTITHILFFNTSTNEQIGETHTVTDMFDAQADTVTLPFPVEGTYNVTVVASNPLENSTGYLATFEMVGQVRGLVIKDEGISTKGEEKWIQLEFESVGASTCVLIDFQDGVVETVGNEDYCREWQPGVDFVPGIDVVNPTAVTHTYNFFGIFNITAEASNFVTNGSVSHERMMIVTSAPCQPPSVMLPINSTDNRYPLPFFRTDTIQLNSLAGLDCSDLLSTRKKWQIELAKVDQETGHDTSLELLDIEAIAPDSYDLATLVIPQRTLMYGVYKLTFYSRMWDYGDSDPLMTHVLPFEGDAYTYIEIKPSPIVPRFSDGIMAVITRGADQVLILEPGAYSEDQDFPEDGTEGMEFRLYCRMKGEEWGMEEDPDFPGYFLYSEENLVPVQPDRSQLPELKGCFGTKPGLLDLETPGFLEVAVKEFVLVDATYEFHLEVFKGDLENLRRVKANLEVNVRRGKPPIMNIKCSDPKLCFYDKQGTIYVNPTSRLALISKCEVGADSNCNDPMTYKWSVKLPEKNITDEELGQSALGGIDTAELALPSTFFHQYGINESFSVALFAENGDAVNGTFEIQLRINQPPNNGSCEIYPTEGVSLMTDFEIVCFDWDDPEEEGGIKHFTVALNDSIGNVDQVAKIEQFASKDDPHALQIKLGIYTLVVTIEDMWGALTVFQIPLEIVVSAPSQDDIGDLFDMTNIDQLSGEGDSSTLYMYLQAQAEIASEAESILIKEESILPDPEPLSPEEEAVELAIQKSEIKAVQIGAIMESSNGRAADLPMAEILANTLGSIISSNTEDEQLSDVSIEVVQKATPAYQNLIESLSELNVPDPNMLIPTIAKIMEGLGTMMTQTMQTASKSTNAKDLCEGLKAADIDKATGDHMIIDTKPSDDPEQQVPEDPEQLICLGVILAAQSAATFVGSAVNDMMKHLVLELLKIGVLNEPIKIDMPPMKLFAQMTPGEKLAEWHVVGDDIEHDASFTFPKHWCLGDLVNKTIENKTDLVCGTPAGLAAISYDINPLCNDPTCTRLARDSKILDMYVTTRDHVLVEVGKVYEQKDDPNSHGGIEINLPFTNASMEGMQAPELFEASLHSKVYAVPGMFHEIDIHMADSALTIEYFPSEDNLEDVILVLLDFERIPTNKKYLHAVVVGDDASQYMWNSVGDFYSIIFYEDKILNRTGRWYFTIYNLTEPIPQQSLTDHVPIESSYITEFHASYGIRTWTSGCYYYNEKTKVWGADGMRIKLTTYTATLCQTTHLTSFGSGFFIRPTVIDFNYIFAEADFEDNVTIYLFVIITLCFFIGIMIFAIIMDRKDEKSLVTRGLADNEKTDKYLYEVLTFTGIWKESSCNSKLYLFASGDNADTGVRLLDGGHKHTLRKGTVDSYMMRTSKPLGNLNYIRVWHDNSGYGDYASWYCSAIVINDVQTNEKFEFICNEWLACEKGDQKIERMVPCSGYAKQNEFAHLFNRHRELTVKENHIWFSIFMRYKRSRFSRAQRTLVAFSMLYLSLLLNAMWYYTMPETVPEGFSLGYFVMSVSQLTVGVLSALATLVPSLFLVFLFRYSRRIKLRENRITLAKKMEDQHWDSVGADEDEASTRISNNSDESGSSDEDSSDEYTGRPHHEPRRHRFTMPWWIKILGWLLGIGLMIFGIVCIFYYGLTFGNDRVHQWLSSALVAVFADILVVQPLLMFFMTCFYSICCDAVAMDYDDIEEDEEQPELYEDLTYAKRNRDKNRGALNPIDEDALEKLRKKRVEEVAMKATLNELVHYGIFIALVYIISYGNRHPSSYLLQQHMRSTFVERNGFDALVTSNDWWDWCHQTILNDLKAQKYYNGVPPFGLQGFIGDKVNRIIGYAVLRQIRVKRNTCKVDKRVHNITQECAKESAIINEDTKDYCNAWEESTALTENFPSCLKPEFKYSTAEELNGLDYSAFVDAYSGGGYVYRLNKASKEIKADLLGLQQDHWINNHTRAVFLEFSTYNANLNLFVIATMVAEFIPGGGILPYARFDVVRLLHHHGTAGTILLIAEIIFVFYILSFLYAHGIMIKTKKCRYFDSKWTWLEWSIIIMSLVAGILYAYRMVLTNEILDIFAKTSGNGYVKLQEVGKFDEFYGYAIGMIMFFATVNFVKLLRFNNRFNILLLTLKACWEDLSGFLAIFALVYAAFVQVFYMILKQDMLEFHTVISTLETCFTMLLNKFKFGSIRENSLTAAVMFFCFAISCSFILINVMLTIILEAYEIVKQQLDEQGNQYEILQYVKQKAKYHLGVERPVELTNPPSAMKKDPYDSLDSDDEVVEEVEDIVEDPNTTNLPHKVHSFLQYINNEYFEGELDLKTKTVLKQTKQREAFAQGMDYEDKKHVKHRKVFNTEVNSRYVPPK